MCRCVPPAMRDACGDAWGVVQCPADSVTERLTRGNPVIISGTPLATYARPTVPPPGPAALLDGTGPPPRSPRVPRSPRIPRSPRLGALPRESTHLLSTGAAASAASQLLPAALPSSPPLSAARRARHQRHLSESSSGAFALPPSRFAAAHHRRSGSYGAAAADGSEALLLRAPAGRGHRRAGSSSGGGPSSSGFSAEELALKRGGARPSAASAPPPGRAFLELYGKGDSVDFDADCCPTCLEEYSESNPAIDTRCGHRFHLACIYEWSERSDTCPVCARVLDFNELLE